MAYRDEVNTPLITVIGLMGALIVFGIIVGLQVIYSSAHTRLRTELDTVQPRELSNLVAEQRAALVEYDYNAQTQRYTIPIRQAMEKTVEELTQQ
jgi:hypothetical protein